MGDKKKQMDTTLYYVLCHVHRFFFHVQCFKVPGASSTSTFVELVYSKRPTDLANTSATISVPDNYSNALIDYTLFRAFIKDAEYAGNATRAATHYQLFTVSVTGKAQIDALIKPDIQIMSNG